MKVTLLQFTPDPERTVAMAARLCYSPRDLDQLESRLSNDEALRLVRMLKRMGHHSPLEHASFTVGVEGVSRALTHQLVRSRIASYSQQSQRYVEENRFEMVTPPSIRSNSDAEEIYRQAMKTARKAYRSLVELGIPSEDARYLLGQGFSSKIIVTMNARAWNHWFQLRCCSRAQWEIRALAYRILKELQAVAPSLFEESGPPCVSEGICREGHMSCGRIETLGPRSGSLLVRPPLAEESGP